MQRLVPIIIDVVAVVAFAVAGRASHGLDPAGVLVTAWPFLVALAVAWGALVVLRDDGYGPGAAILVWLVTLAGGMGLRLASGDTAAVPFVIVATLFLAAAFGGWRLVAWLLRHRRAA